MFVAVIVGASLIQASHAVLYGFVTLQWTNKGLDGTTIGLLWAIGVGAEILLFAVSGRVIARFGAVEMILLGGIGAVLRWTAMAFDPATILLPLLQCLHGLSFGATHLGAMDALSQLAHRQGGATAQGDFSAVQGVTFAAAMGASGSPGGGVRQRRLFRHGGARRSRRCYRACRAANVARVVSDLTTCGSWVAWALAITEVPQDGTMAASSRPCRKIIFVVRPPRRTIQLRRSAG